jgi:hypothetical protein
MGEADVESGSLRQAFVCREFLGIVQRQGIPHPPRYRPEGADSSPVQSRRRLVRHYPCQKQFCLSVNKRSYTGVFTGAFSGVPFPIPRPGLLFNDFRTFINGDTVRYLSAAVFCPLPLARFCLSLPEMLFQGRVFRCFPVEAGANGRC